MLPATYGLTPRTPTAKAATATFDPRTSCRQSSLRPVRRSSTKHLASGRMVSMSHSPTGT